MAIVINPDGTVSTIETTHDQYGNLRPKIDSEVMKEQEIHYNKNTISASKGERGYVYPTSAVTKKKKKRVAISRPIPPKRQQIFVTYAEIDMFFNDRRASGKWLGTSEYEKIKNKLPKIFKQYFTTKYLEYLEQSKPKKKPKKRTTFKMSDEEKRQKYLNQINELEQAMKRTTFSKPKVKKKKKKISHQVKEVMVHHNSHAGSTIGEIANFGSLRGEYASSSDYDVRTSNPPRPARPPKYAYARDRYGRVQERDSFNEEKKNEFYTAQNRQKNYDYSSFDANDDNDGAYSDWE